jgi:division protein CdvB (Snf7/Vps24/ESCRT-III family)
MRKQLPKVTLEDVRKNLVRALTNAEIDEKRAEALLRRGNTRTEAKHAKLHDKWRRAQTRVEDGKTLLADLDKRIAENLVAGAEVKPAQPKRSNKAALMIATLAGLAGGLNLCPTK